MIFSLNAGIPSLYEENVPCLFKHDPDERYLNLGKLSLFRAHLIAITSENAILCPSKMIVLNTTSTF